MCKLGAALVRQKKRVVPSCRGYGDARHQLRSPHRPERFAFQGKKCGMNSPVVQWHPSAAAPRCPLDEEIRRGRMAPTCPRCATDRVPLVLSVVRFPCVGILNGNLKKQGIVLIHQTVRVGGIEVEAHFGLFIFGRVELLDLSMYPRLVVMLFYYWCTG